MKSKMLTVLKGKQVNGKTVKDIEVAGGNRVVSYTDGTKDTMSKSALLQEHDREAAKGQAGNMRKSRRYNDDGSVQQTIGGTEKGRRQTYINKKAAETALKRHYGK